MALHEIIFQNSMLVKTCNICCENFEAISLKMLSVDFFFIVKVKMISI